jgi:hypothetical protein
MAFVRPGVFPAPRDAAYPASLDYVKQPARSPPHSVQSHRETSCLSMCWAVLDLFLAGARGLGLSDLEYKQVGPMKIARTHRQQPVSKVA